jgi:RNA-directed DNA polymerase
MSHRLPPDRQGGQVRAICNLVAPLSGSPDTEKRLMEDAGESRARSGAVASLIGVRLRHGDIDRAISRSTRPTPTTPGTRTSTTATRTTPTRTTSFGRASSADHAQDADQAEFSFEALVKAYFDCREHKRNTVAALSFEADLERLLWELFEELRSGQYRPGPSICFVITRPKPREVWAAAFRDRIVHHLLHNHIAPRFYASFITDSCACIPGRGTLYAAERLEAKVRGITHNWSRRAFYLKCDLSSFFVSIDKRICRELLRRRIAPGFWRDLADTVLLHDPRSNYELRGSEARLALIPARKSLFRQDEHHGLPIGNLSSQFFANVYLDVLDQFVKHGLRARHYIRYVDDFVLLHDSPQWLNAAKACIEERLATHLSLELNPRKTILQPIERGIDFVGQVIKPWRRITRRRTVNVGLQRMENIEADRFFETANSYFGLLRQATRSHGDRARFGRVALQRGHCVPHDLTKILRRGS